MNNIENNCCLQTGIYCGAGVCIAGAAAGVGAASLALGATIIPSALTAIQAAKVGAAVGTLSGVVVGPCLSNSSNREEGNNESGSNSSTSLLSVASVFFVDSALIYAFTPPMVGAHMSYVQSMALLGAGAGSMAGIMLGTGCCAMGVATTCAGCVDLLENATKQSNTAEAESNTAEVKDININTNPPLLKKSRLANPIELTRK